MPNFRLRDGHPNDLDRITDITLSAMKSVHDDLFAYNFPYCDAFPDDNRNYWKLRLEPAAYRPAAKFLVVEEVSEGKVIAWADWNWNSAAKKNPAPESFPDNDTIGKAFARTYISP